MTGMLTLSNLLAWSAQSALLIAAALLMTRIVRLDAPAVRHTFLRAVLAACLLLPLVQPHVVPAVRAGGDVVSSESFALSGAPGSTAFGAGMGLPLPFGGRSAAALALILMMGALARLAWVGAGIVRLRALRRAGEVASANAEQDDLQRTIGARATIRYVRRLGQPVTFGFRHPVVLLPESLLGQHPSIQRAVLAHELWHVRRRDWMWTVIEEALRAVCWFHPAIWMLLSRIQATREEVVDELTVLATGSRRSYVDALLAYADEPPLFAATAFARRRHLVHRLVLISREAVMSAKRVMACCAVLVAVTACSGWYAVQAFPMTQAQDGEVFSNVPGPMEARSRPVTPENPVPRRTSFVPPQYPPEAAALNMRGSVVVRLTLDESGMVAETRAVTVSVPGMHQAQGRAASGAGAVDRLVDGVPVERREEVRRALLALAHSAVRAVGQWRYDRPAEGPISFFVTVHVPPAPDGAAETQTTVTVPGATAAPARERPGIEAPRQMEAEGALRVGGNIKAPTKIRHVNPVYPPEAQDARVSGVVILETRIEPDGTVGDVRVLRSIPLLDHAAEEAVRQWQFTPTWLNGQAMPVIMTVTVNFTLQ